MISRLFYQVFMISVLLTGNIFSEVTICPKPLNSNVWLADTLYVGAEILSFKPDVPVFITIKKHRDNAPDGKLYFIKPDNDSAVFLIPNSCQDTSINIGVFPGSTDLVFMFTVTDISQTFDHYRNQRLYTGQNRDGVDKFVSERNIPLKYGWKYGARWAVVGSIDSSRVEVGFEDRAHYNFRGIVFEVTNAKIKK